MATLLMRTPDLRPIVVSASETISPHPQDGKTNEEDGGSQRSFGPGRYRSRKTCKNIGGVKRQPQRGLGVAQLERIRLQEEEEQQKQQASYLAPPPPPPPPPSYPHPLALHFTNTHAPYAASGSRGNMLGYITPPSPKLGAVKTGNSPRMGTVLWPRSPNFIPVLFPHVMSSANSNSRSRSTPHPSRSACGLTSTSTSAVPKPPFVFSEESERVFTEIEGYTRTSTAKDDHLFPSTYLGTNTDSTTSKGTFHATSFQEFNATKSSMERVHDASKHLPASQPLRFQNDSKSIGDSSQELSSFQNNLHNTAWCQTEKTCKKRSWDTLQESCSITSHSLAMALSVAPPRTPHDDGPPFRIEFPSTNPIASTKKPLLNLNRHIVYSHDCSESGNGDDGATMQKDFLSLCLSTSRFPYTHGKAQKAEDSVQESNGFVKETTYKLTKTGLNGESETTEFLACQESMGESKGGFCSTADIPSRSSLIERSIDEYEEKQQLCATICPNSASISSPQDYHSEEVDNSHLASSKCAKLNLRLDLSL